MKKTKKIFSLIIAAAMVASTLVLKPDEKSLVLAAQNAAVVKILNTARSHIGQHESDGSCDNIIDTYNRYCGTSFTHADAWCAIGLSSFFIEAGMTDIMAVSSGCTTMRNKFKDRGRWKGRDYSPVPGDLVLYDWDRSGDCDHVGILETTDNTTLTVIECNYNDSVGRRYINKSSNLIAGFVSPDYNSITSSYGEAWTRGDFVAYIILRKDWRHLTVSNGNVQIADFNDISDPRQIWTFKYCGNEEYVVFNETYGQTLNAFGSSEGSNIGIYPCHDGGAPEQRWRISSTPSGDILQSVVNSNLVMDSYNASSAPGNNIQLWTRNQTEAQYFSVYPVENDNIVYKMPDCPDAPKLSISAGQQVSLGENIVISWTAAPTKSDRYDERRYRLELWDPQGLRYTWDFDADTRSLEGSFSELGEFAFQVYAVNTKYVNDHEALSNPVFVTVVDPMPSLPVTSANPTATPTPAPSVDLVVPVTTTYPAMPTVEPLTPSTDDHAFMESVITPVPTATPVPTSIPEPTTASVAVPTAEPTAKPTSKPVNKPASMPTATTKPTSAKTTTTASAAVPTRKVVPETTELNFSDFVTRLYSVALNRTPEKDGLDFWSDMITSGKYSGADCALNFLLSDEFNNRGLSTEDFVETLYRTFFDRDSEPEGKEFWVSSIENGSLDRVNVILGFVDSAEWKALCSAYDVRSGAPSEQATMIDGAEAFASRLYTSCLGREPDKDGLEYWAGALYRLEVSGSTAAAQFFGSAEFQGLNTDDEEYITRLYRTFMGREPEAEGIAFWLDCLTSGMTRGDVFSNFVCSEEFASLCIENGISR